jgi:hypothetical protein
MDVNPHTAKFTLGQMICHFCKSVIFDCRSPASIVDGPPIDGSTGQCRLIEADRHSNQTPRDKFVWSARLLAPRQICESNFGAESQARAGNLGIRRLGKIFLEGFSTNDQVRRTIAACPVILH